MCTDVRADRRWVDAHAPRRTGGRHRHRGSTRGGRGLTPSAPTRTRRAAEPEEILRDLLGLDAGLTRRSYYGERSVFYNPGGVAPLGTIVASIKDGDGPNDKSSALSRPGVFRFAFQLSRDEYVRRFGAVPPRPQKGAAVELPGVDVTRLGELAPHPVYAWMRWVQILSPTREQYEALKPLVFDSLAVVKARWRRRKIG